MDFVHDQTYRYVITWFFFFIFVHCLLKIFVEDHHLWIPTFAIFILSRLWRYSWQKYSLGGVNWIEVNWRRYNQGNLMIILKIASGNLSLSIEHLCRKYSSMGKHHWHDWILRLVQFCPHPYFAWEYFKYFCVFYMDTQLTVSTFTMAQNIIIFWAAWIFLVASILRCTPAEHHSNTNTFYRSAIHDE